MAVSPNYEGQCLAPNWRSKELGVDDHHHISPSPLGGE